MSSPNHLTSGIEDAFSSNFPDFIPASPDYVPASPGKTYSNSSNSFDVVPIALPTLLLFHDDPYMKVMQAFYAEKSPIPPPTIIPQSSMLNPQEFFLPRELLPPKKRGCSSSSTFSLPQDFEIGESSRKTSLERHEEQIEEILNHLDELSLDRIEYIEEKIERLRKGRCHCGLGLPPSAHPIADIVIPTGTPVLLESDRKNGKIQRNLVKLCNISNFMVRENGSKLAFFSLGCDDRLCILSKQDVPEENTN
ncbi:hypothetical protein Tco_0425749 [Tanacetum coccineum]